MSIQEKKIKKSVHATISNESVDIIQKYEKEYGSRSAVVDEALKILKIYREPHNSEIKDLWCRARDELNMVLVGKTTFLSYLKGNLQEVFKNNIALEVIEWYIGKRKEEMNLEEFLNGLIGMWQVANYFYNIELDKNKDGVFQIKFKHDLTRDYSEYWSDYFKNLLEKNWSCLVEPFVRNESFYLIISENSKRIK
ncbi:MAG: hypothetical protein JXA99_14980 [Candidatus Lokiarchaeota archaeon]|nr:hypothetical protein [Candidatus Lokiarchaeota archaeon]